VSGFRRRRPGGTEIGKPHLEALDLEPHGAAAGEVEGDDPVGRVDRLEAEREQLEDGVGRRGGYGAGAPP
jgi:hypothetical protein